MQLRIHVAREGKFTLVVRARLEVRQRHPTVTFPSPNRDRRNFRRVRVSSRITMSWRDSEYKERSFETRCLNMSRRGALVLTGEPFSPGTTVYISVKILRTSGSATVRHCTARGSKFLIGLEFTELLNSI